MKTYILITENDEKNIEKRLRHYLRKPNSELIIFDNKSTDLTVNIIITMVANFMLNKVITEDNFRFFINNEKETRKETIKKAKKLAKGEIRIIRRANDKNK